MQALTPFVAGLITSDGEQLLLLLLLFLELEPHSAHMRLVWRNC
jgi:hypothetical protein